MKKKMNDRNGYTFIEILVVVTIIGIISTIGLVTYTEFLKKSRDSKRKGDLEIIRGALELYRDKNNAYPFPAISFGGNLCDPLGCAAGTYITKIANDPRDANTYYYTSTDGSTYTLCAYLEQPPTSPSSAGNCIKVGTLTCNYCMGPFGQL